LHHLADLVFWFKLQFILYSKHFLLLKNDFFSILWRFNLLIVSKWNHYSVLAIKLVFEHFEKLSQIARPIGLCLTEDFWDLKIYNYVSLLLDQTLKSLESEFNLNRHNTLNLSPLNFMVLFFFGSHCK